MTKELTKREREIVELIKEGKTNREISERLLIVKSTINGHIYRIKVKLGVKTRTQMVLALVSSHSFSDKCPQCNNVGWELETNFVDDPLKVELIPCLLPDCKHSGRTISLHVNHSSGSFDFILKEK